MKKLLDVGCGPGAIGNIRYYEELQKNYDIYGIDFLAKNVARIKKKFPQGKFLVGNATSLPFSNNYFDAVVARHILEHVKDPKVVLSEIYRVSKKGALLTIAVPDRKLEKLLAHLLPSYLKGDYHHHMIIGERDLKSFVKKAGFRIIKFSKKRWFLFVVILFLALLSRATTKIKMEKQSGVFSIGDSTYIENEITYHIYKRLYIALSILDKIFGFLNKLIPFEIELIAKKN